MFHKYIRKNTADMRQVTELDIYKFGKTVPNKLYAGDNEVSISQEDMNNGSPQCGDMIARNPKNHNDLWLVAGKYFKDNFKLESD